MKMYKLNKDIVNKYVIFNGATEEQIKWGSNDDPNKSLKIGKKYKVCNIEIHSWHTKIELKGITGKFNDVSFTYI